MSPGLLLPGAGISWAERGYAKSRNWLPNVITGPPESNSFVQGGRQPFRLHARAVRDPVSGVAVSPVSVDSHPFLTPGPIFQMPEDLRNDSSP